MLSLYLSPLMGGVLIGLASGSLYLFSGRIAGISGIASKAMLGPARAWRVAFIAGLLVAGLAGALVNDPTFVAGLETRSLPMLAFAGLLVGIGTAIGSGCTSGHGICGLSRLSRRSVVAVIVFVLSASITVFVLRHGGIA